MGGKIRLHLGSSSPSLRTPDLLIFMPTDLGQIVMTVVVHSVTGTLYAKKQGITQSQKLQHHTTTD